MNMPLNLQGVLSLAGVSPILAAPTTRVRIHVPASDNVQSTPKREEETSSVNYELQEYVARMREHVESRS